MTNKLQPILVWLGLILYATVPSAFAQTSETDAADRPNIVWIMAEDIGVDLECYGMAAVKTPNLNRLASEGTKFTRAYCSSPICSTCRSSMMVGVDQTAINAHHHRSNRDQPLLAPYKPITSYLREAGYCCVLGFEPVRGHGAKTDLNFKHTPLGEWDGKENFGVFDRMAPLTAEDQPFFNQFQLGVTHRGDWWSQVREESEHPVSVDDVILPPYLADTAEVRLDWATYLDTIEKMDDQVGLFMQQLKDKGLDKNTVVIFIGDNGRCNLRGKGFLQESGIHVPLIVWAPGLVESGAVNEELVCMTDISASILKLAQAKIPAYMSARPFIGVEEPNYRQYVRSARDIWDEIDDCSRSITTKQFTYIKNWMPDKPWDTDHAYQELNRPALHVMRSLKAAGQLSEAEMAFFKDKKPAEELYDNQNDPDQLTNLAADPGYADALEEMRFQEADWLSKNRDFGLEDLGKRSPDAGLKSVAVREAVKQKAPELWRRLESGELMKTQSWNKYARKREKESKADQRPQTKSQPQTQKASP